MSLRDRWRAFLLWRLKRRLAGPKLIRAFASAYPEAFFVEIGANDGEQWDPLRPFILHNEWRGVMVEPLPSVFERLRRNYGSLGRVALENAAIAERDGKRPLYHLAEVEDPERERLPAHYDAFGSFSREVLLRHSYIPDLERRIVATEVTCMRLGSLFAKHDVDRVDLLMIDTEGYDFEIVKQIDFDSHRPRLLIYEHGHLSRGDRDECSALLRRRGYETMEEYMDTWCLDVGPDDTLTRSWRDLRPAIPGVYWAD